eukprot:TRINITY_DN8191_c0_g2_i2.p1 TRINITY_DN8191_c0_g2~~TRINITY_DN8191_c0_g2_i2.p1  ORF type:complete len:192 (-),score=36.94 TRINITY_DN8191_c0_g2_i2:35-610(-)
MCIRDSTEVELSVEDKKLDLDQGYLHLVHNLLKKPKLTSLSLNISRCTFSDGVMTRTLIPHPKITYLSLNFSQVGFADSDLIAFANGISKLQTLTDLKLAFDSSAVSKVGVSHLCDILMTLPKLSLFHLSLVGCLKVGDKGVEKIASLIKSKKKLIDISLNLTYNRLSKPTEEEIRNLKTIRKFTNCNTAV